MKKKTAATKPTNFKAYVYEVIVGGVLKAYLFLNKMR